MDDNAFKNTFFKDIWRFVTNRVLILAVIAAAAFYFLAFNLFDLQIVNGQSYIKAVAATYPRTITVTAPRGTVYDRMGRPLALNTTAYSVKIDPSGVGAGANAMLYSLIKLFEANGQEYVDDFPISLHEPYEFEWSENRGVNWKKNMNVPEDATAYETIDFLREQFGIDPAMSRAEARKLLSLRSLLYMQRFSQYNTVTVAYNVSMEVMVAIEERGREFTGVFVDAEPLREYPAGQYVSHIMGYIGRISEDDYNAHKDEGYSLNSMYGRSGIERAFEPELRGVDGERTVETNGVGTVLRTLESVPPVQGGKVFLTLDSVLQKNVYHLLENTLRDVLKAKLQGASARERAVALPQLFASMVNADNISIRDILESPPGSDSYAVREYIVSAEPGASVSQIDEDERAEAVKTVKAIIADGLNSGKIRPASMLLVMLEQGIITGGENFAGQLRAGRISPLAAVFDKLDSGEITPRMTNLDPCTGSVVVTDVKTGGILAAIGYPTYDNNEMVNNFNNEYYQKLMRDPTTPMRNRPFMEARAPGSTFKMVSAVAALESGVITPATTIYDRLAFQKAGPPFAHCHSSVSHGSVNVVSALAVSCNYFFCDAIYTVGTEKSGGAGREILNRYMDEFGFNSGTGVEISERPDEIKATIANRGWPGDTPIMSSPLYKEFSMKLFNPDVPPGEYTWFDGDTVRTAIGQAYSQYSAVTMAKYVATLATGGVRYQSHLLDRVTTRQDEPVRVFEPVTERVIELKPETLESVYKGMLEVTEGGRGTAYSVFRDFPIRVAGKTGTAEESGARPEHSSFAAFAPFDSPEIAVYVMVPFGDTRHYTQVSAKLARGVIAEYFGQNAAPEYAAETSALAK